MHIYTHPEFTHHEVAEGHPERPERLTYLMAHLAREGLLDTFLALRLASIVVWLLNCEENFIEPK